MFLESQGTKRLDIYIYIYVYIYISIWLVVWNIFYFPIIPESV